MTVIKNIHPLPKGLTGSEKTDASRELKPQPKSGVSGVDPNALPKTDQVTISPTAQTLLQEGTELNKYITEVSRLPGMDADRLAAIKRKISRGEYLTEQVTSAVVDQLFQELKKEKTETPAIDTEAIRKNILQGKYNTDEIIDTIVRRILDEEF